ncbi:MAG: Type 1 glutamine amidotransferase-like domain-containing protein [Ignavibacteria bacterium]|nr:Type 1 glutamine amidotransferase-like domain-containing protein [Ignavibacteria bacterium]
MMRIIRNISEKIGRLKSKNHNGQIIALGGGGFSDQPDNLLLDEYILLQTNKLKPKVLFLPTAGGDHPEYIEKFYRSYKKLNCHPTHLELSKKAPPTKKLENTVMSQDIIFVGGGSPRFLMQVWRKTGMTKILKKAWREGIILSGMSAGAICWFEDGFKNPKDDIWMRISCLGLLEGSFCPHYDKMGELRKAYRNMIRKSEISPGYGVEDGVALHFKGTELFAVVSNLRESKAFHVRRSGYRVIEKEIKPSYLGILNDSYIETIEQELKHTESVNVVKEYIKRINSHDLISMLEITDDDAVFIDSMGINTRGKAEMKKAWDLFLTFFPDYTVEIKDIICKNGMVAVFGKAKGTLAENGRLKEENRFEIPASWTAEVRNGKILKWRVYADNEPVRKLIEKYK